MALAFRKAMFVDFEPVRRAKTSATAMRTGCKGVAATGLLLALLFIVSARADAQAEQPAADTWFDIPAQPLVTALEAYAAATGTVAIYNGNLASGRTSSAVKGSLTPQKALPALLQGTGLQGAFTTSKAFVVVAAEQRPLLEAPRAIAAAALTQRGDAEWRYAALLQRNVNDALCAQPVTEPGGYRVAMQIWIGTTGVLARVRLLNTTGDRSRDDAIAAIAGRVSMGEPPPAHMVQPVTMVLLPRSSGGEVSCPQLSGGLRHG